MRILLADDSSLILERIQNIVSKFKQVEIVGSCKTGVETLDALRRLKPDFTIVDINMPGLSGLDVLKEIRKENKILKFLILTFYASENYRQIAMQSGADFFLSKVDDFEKLPKVIEKLLIDENPPNGNKTYMHSDDIN